MNIWEDGLGLDPRLAQQSLGRALTESEMTFARVLEEVFSGGAHVFAETAAELERRKTPRPSGKAGPWTEDVLMQELTAINASLDQAYADSGLGA